MAGHVWVLILAVIGLALGVVARLRDARNGSKRARGHNAMLMIPCAIIIGTLPWVLQPGETVKVVASVASMVVSVAAMVLLVIQTHRAERESPGRPPLRGPDAVSGSLPASMSVPQRSTAGPS